MPTVSAPAIEIRIAHDSDREAIYRLRHRVYAQELRQHAVNAEGRLSDALDASNEYIVATADGEVSGFISITPPGGQYSIDKYFRREELPLLFDDGLFELRILTVAPEHRGTTIAAPWSTCRPGAGVAW